MGAAIDEVRETIEMRPITPVFRTPACVAGIVNLRGEIIAILDVGIMMGLGPNRRDPSARIVVVDVEVDGQPRSAGLLVDALGPIRDVAHDAPCTPPLTMPASVRALIEGVVSLPSHPLAVLDLRRVLGAPELAPFMANDSEP